MKRLTFVKEGRLNVGFASPSKKLALDHYSKMKEFIKIGIVLHDELFPETPLITKEDSKEVEQNSNVYTLDSSRVGGGQAPWSRLYIISTDSRSRNPGLTLHYLFLDETQMMEYASVNENLIPMTSRTGGSIICSGTTLPDAKNLIYNMYRKQSIEQKRKILRTAFDVYKSIALRSMSEAEDYWRRFKSEVAEHGLHSDYIRSQYLVSFDIKGDRWITIETLEEQQVFNIPKMQIENIEGLLHGYTRQGHRYYRIGSFDSAKKTDYAAFIAGILEVYIKDDVEYYKTYATDFIIINDDEKQQNTIIDPEKLTERVSRLAVKMELDMVVYEATANQSDRAFYLQKDFNKRKSGIKTIPIDYAGKNKEKIFLKAESEIGAGRAFLPHLNNEAHSRGYREFIEEMKNFKKEYTGSSIKFYGPEGRGNHDDFVSAWVNFIYLPHLINSKKEKGASVGLGVSYEYDYPFDWYKQEEDFTKSISRAYGYK